MRGFTNLDQKCSNHFRIFQNENLTLLFFRLSDHKDGRGWELSVSRRCRSDLRRPRDALLRSKKLYGLYSKNLKVTFFNISLKLQLVQSFSGLCNSLLIQLRLYCK